MDFLAKTLVNFKYLCLSFLLLFNSPPAIAEVVEGYSFKGYIQISLNTMELGNFAAGNGFFINSRDSIGLELKHVESYSQTPAFQKIKTRTEKTRKQEISPENIKLKAGMKFLEVSENRFKISFIIVSSIRDSEEKPKEIIEHLLTGSLDQKTSYRFSSKDSHELNVELQIFKQENQIQGIAALSISN